MSRLAKLACKVFRAWRAHLTMILLFAVCSSYAFGQSIIYDSDGFESPPYSVGLLVPFNGWSTTEFLLGIGTNDAGIVQSAVTCTGTQALQIIGPNVNDNQAFGFIGETFWTQTGFGFDASGSTVTIEWSMRVDAPPALAAPATLYSLEFEGLIGGLALDRINLVGLSPNGSGANDVVVQFPAVGLVPILPGFAFGMWHNFVVDLDFGAEQMFITVDGVAAPAPVAFLNSGFTVFEEVNVHTVFPDPFLPPANDGFYDDIIVSAGLATCTAQDHAAYVDCMSAPGRTPMPTPPTTPLNCVESFDDDNDLDVDLVDFAQFAAGCNF